jgi:hypothetical protein
LSTHCYGLLYHLEDPKTGIANMASVSPHQSRLFKTLQQYFPFVHRTRTQPNHPEFPLDWSTASGESGLIRIVLVASRTALDMPLLSPGLLEKQEQFVEL